VLTWVMTKTEAYTGDEQRAVAKHAKKMASALNLEWSKTTPESWHARIAAFDHRSLLANWHPLKGAIDEAAWGEYSIERNAFFGIILQMNRLDQKRYDLKKSVVGHAKYLFDVRNLPS
jgi:hypothetical protein